MTIMQLDPNIIVNKLTIAAEQITADRPKAAATALADLISRIDITAQVSGVTLTERSYQLLHELTQQVNAMDEDDA